MNKWIRASKSIGRYEQNGPQEGSKRKREQREQSERLLIYQKTMNEQHIV